MKLLEDFKKFLKSKNKRLAFCHYYSIPYIFSYPNSATVELGFGCNLRCPVCETTAGPGRAKGILTFEKFRVIMDEIGPHLHDLILSADGEPFMNKEIYKMFGYTRKVAPKAFIYLDTNGHFMDTEKLFENPPDEIVFSIDGLDQKTYETYRIRGNLLTVLKNLKSVTEYKKKNNLSKPNIIIKFIVMKHNEHQVDKLQAFASEIGADDYRIELFTTRTTEHAEQFMSTIKAFQKYDAEKLKENILAPYIIQYDTACPNPFKHADICWNGDVRPCCTDWGGKYKWGNIFEAGSFWKVWNGEKAKEFRRIHKTPKFRKDISICTTCQLTNCEFDEKRNSSLSLERSGRQYVQIDLSNLK
jgi:radical SAM protein with 4Fe4S-binding SPASM domain